MMRNKITFRLASLVVLLALVLVIPCAFAGDFTTELSIEDVSFADKSFPQYQHDIQVEFDVNTVVYVKFDKVVDYRADTNNNGSDDVAEFADTGIFTHHDVVVLIYNEIGQVFATRSNPDEVGIGPRDPNQHDGKNYTITFNTRDPDPRIEDHNRVLVYIKQGSVTAVDPAVEEADSKNAEGSVAFNLVYSDGRRAAADGYEYPNDDSRNTVGFHHPAVYEISRTDRIILPSGVTEPFTVRIRLSEQARSFTTDHIDVVEGKATEVILLGHVHPFNLFGPSTDLSFRYLVPTGRGLIGVGTVYYEYIVTIEPKFENKNDIVIKVKAFEDLVKPTSKYNPNAPYKYTPPTSENDYVEGFDKLTVKVGKEVLKDKTAGLTLEIPKEIRIPKDGYLVLATDIGGSGVKDNPGNDKDEPKATERTPAQLLYNVIALGLPNLETFLANGGIIDVVGPEKVVISEIMWGTDASLDPNNNSQWIELKNKSGKSLLTGDKNYKLMFYGPNEAPPAKVAVAAVAETATTKAQPASMALPEGVMDRVGTIDEKGAYWSIVGKGQSGRSGVDEKAADIVAVVPTQAIISMYRVADSLGDPMNGQMASSWMQSTPPGVNFDTAKVGVRVGSPGAARLITAAQQKALDDEAAAKAKADAAKADTSVSMPAVGQIYISEIMVAGGGTLPQWIEISNGSRTEVVNLSGWTLTVDNAAADADVSVGASIKFTIPEGTKIDPSGQNDTPSTILVVTEAGRNNVDGSDQVLNLWTANQTELILAGVTKRRYSLLSDMAFEITLAPPAPKKTNVAALAATATAAQKAAAQAADAKVALALKAATDTAGNLGADGAAAWALPMSEEGGRSSLIRRHVPVSVGPAEPEKGTMMESWVLASDTSFAQITHVRVSSYYGAMNDVGTPGFRAGGALPVELSHFRPARNKETGAAVITWSTQSELNNAGFFIKRSQQRDGEFQVINATMIPGAGTTSEKQFYTYTDTTAQPNVVYYYQIEDVSLDGNRQTLTRGIRLKGHVGAVGKATTTWGDLKQVQE